MQYPTHSFIIIYHHTTFFTSKSLPPIYALLRQIKFTVFVSIGWYLIFLREAQLTQSTPYNTIRFTFWMKVNLIVLTIYSEDWIFSSKKLRWSIKFAGERAGQDSSLSDWLHHWYVQRNEGVREYPCECDNVSKWLKSCICRDKVILKTSVPQRLNII